MILLSELTRRRIRSVMVVCFIEPTPKPNLTGLVESRRG